MKKNTSYSPSATAEKKPEFFEEAVFLFRTDRFPQALTRLHQLLESQTDYPGAYLLIARVQLALRKTARAEEALRQFHDSSPKSLESLTLLAEVRLRQYQYQECENILEEIFQIKRNHLEAVRILGGLRFKTGCADDAIRIWEALYTRELRDKELLYCLIRAHFKAGNWEDVPYFCKRLKKLGWRSPGRLDALCRIALRESENKPNFLGMDATLLKNFMGMTWRSPGKKPGRLEPGRERAAKRAQQQRPTDELTQLLNMKAARILIPEWMVAARENFYLGFADLDYFKSINDCHCHAVGDAVLAAFAEVGLRFFKDRLFRVGGEEFLWCFVGSESRVLALSEEFRDAVEKEVKTAANRRILEMDLRDPRQKPILVHYPVTLSQGIAEYGVDGRTFEELRLKADFGAYLAKDAGRNCVVFRSELKSGGLKPVQYTRGLLEVLDTRARGRGYSCWWEMEKQIPEVERAKSLQECRYLARDKEFQWQGV